MFLIRLEFKKGSIQIEIKIRRERNPVYFTYLNTGLEAKSKIDNANKNINPIECLDVKLNESFCRK